MYDIAISNAVFDAYLVPLNGTLIFLLLGMISKIIEMCDQLYITIGLLTTIKHCNWPQFNWVKDVNSTTSIQ